MRSLRILALCLLLAACGSSTYSWGWYVVLPTTQQGTDNLRFLLSGLGWTVSVSLLAMLISVLLGLLVALPGISERRWLRLLNRGYVEIVRAVPVLVMLLWVYYGLPVVLGISLDAFAAAVLALALSDSAFEAEIFRGGIQSVARGQHEAAEALGLSWTDKMRYVVLPQALRRVLPPLGNQFAYMLKMSALASVIGLTELTRRANELVVNVYRPLEIYSFLVLEYLVLILLVSWLVRRVERRLGSDESRA
ncbi:amino acid ABC transporter permease [Marinimicrococcus flavescens]|uniref:Glutamate/aspartate import permease protein GltK n=1 Tax=Marinimicrococcus flavescens TaxID=3031815 RepID=A0AAP4D5L6_9PROT|nr:amino acid ABC transporter permease [Marinimicrococcus flavescens]